MAKTRIESQWWFNEKTGQVEQGPQSPQRDRTAEFADARRGAARARPHRREQRVDDEDRSTAAGPPDASERAGPGRRATAPRTPPDH